MPQNPVDHSKDLIREKGLRSTVLDQSERSMRREQEPR